ncbi:sugar ABC transporter substrate-binding protein [Pseudobacteroides cellulosolvens]|uniref:Periplasmic binding protein domain containing protein n=1 Tax=Pseudobacteroides cellulosolvens ATCC 35603 = DSM 2933 TaxID=398512 RepID=A0A0L6JWK7_9FIRM|nr:substrate-binding domain-containing protein [Pseudobacteroides cellulosolvens]KNY30226.1 Periplasmic binding protein domain containing protein [Pseudobacteroides cellulosolvens ATCC 35603 = DSM 2933]
MAKRYKVLMIMVVLAAITISGVILYSIKAGRKDQPINFKYTFAFIPHQKYDPYWVEVRKGVEDVARKENISLQVMESDWVNEKAQLDFFNIAILSKVDGIIAHSYDKPQFTDVINKAQSEGIPVITIDSDSPLSSRSAYIGIDYNYAGRRAAEALMKSLRGKAHVAVLLPNTGNDARIKAFQEEVHSAGHVIDTIEKTDSNILGARGIIRRIFREYPDINYVFCTDYNDTIGVAREIVDLNKSEKIKIIGFECMLKDGIDSEMQTYIDTGTILANMVQNPYYIGRNAMIKMINHKKGNKDGPLEAGYDLVFTKFSE